MKGTKKILNNSYVRIKTKIHQYSLHRHIILYLHTFYNHQHFDTWSYPLFQFQKHFPFHQSILIHFPKVMCLLRPKHCTYLIHTA